MVMTITKRRKADSLAHRNVCPSCRISRRQFLRSGTSLAAAAAGSTMLPRIRKTADSLGTAYEYDLNGSKEPFPIPWLDKNGSHNQSPGPGHEPSNIYHFKGFVARCNGFTGMGSDNQGNRIAFGSASTDFSFMDGTYFAGRVQRTGSFSHI
jgi:hypothetical protein